MCPLASAATAVNLTVSASSTESACGDTATSVTICSTVTAALPEADHIVAVDGGPARCPSL